MMSRAARPVLVLLLVLAGTTACEVPEDWYRPTGGLPRVPVVGDAVTHSAAPALSKRLTEHGLRPAQVDLLGGWPSEDQAIDYAGSDALVRAVGAEAARGATGATPGEASALAHAAVDAWTTARAAADQACVVGVTVPTGSAMAPTERSVADEINAVVRAESDAVADLDAAVAGDLARHVDPQGALTTEGAAAYADRVAAAMASCSLPVAHPIDIAVAVDEVGGTHRFSWEPRQVLGIGGSGSVAVRSIVGYDVHLRFGTATFGWPARLEDPWLDLPSAVLRPPRDIEIAFRVTAHLQNGTVTDTGQGWVTIPAWTEPLPTLDWSVGTPTVVVADAERRAEGLTWWIDGNVGFVDVDGQVRAFAANGPRSSSWTVTQDRFLADPITTGLAIEGIDPGVDYAAGGPVHRDPASGALFLFYHGEEHPDGDPKRFWSFVGLAVSHDDGATFEDLGPIVTPHTTPDTPGWTGALEVGGAPFAIEDGWFHVYFRDVVPEPDHFRVLDLAVARAPVAEVVQAGLAGRSVAWTKWGQEGWTEPGLGGRPADLFGFAPHPNWFDTTYLVDHDVHLLVASHGGGLDWSYWWSVSRDGLHWTPPRTLLDEPAGAETLYVSLSSPDRRSQRNVVGDVVHLYRTRSTLAEDGITHRWNGDVTIDRIDLSLSVPSS
jgi:hypothetical protein